MDYPKRKQLIWYVVDERGAIAARHTDKVMAEALLLDCQKLYGGTFSLECDPRDDL